MDEMYNVAETELVQEDYSLSADGLEHIRLMFRLITPFSIFANGIVFICVVFIKSKRNRLGLIPAYLAMSDSCTSICLMMGTSIVDKTELCQVAGALFHFCLVASSSWSFLVALYCYLTVLYNKTVNWTWFNVYAWSLSAISTASLFIVQETQNNGNVIGDAHFECWIANQYSYLRFYAFYSILYSHFILTICIYMRIFVSIHAAEKGLERMSRSQEKDTQNSGRYSTKQAIPLRSIRVSALTATSGDVMENNVRSAIVQQQSLRESSSSSPQSQSIRKSQSIVSMDSRNQGPNNSAKMNENGISKMKSSRNKLIVKSCIVAIGFLVSWLPATAQRSFTMPPWWQFVTAFGLSISGFPNSISFFIGMMWDRNRK